MNEDGRRRGVDVPHYASAVALLNLLGGLLPLLLLARGNTEANCLGRMCAQVHNMATAFALLRDGRFSIFRAYHIHVLCVEWATLLQLV
jgi:hypothetical protein